MANHLLLILAIGFSYCYNVHHCRRLQSSDLKKELDKSYDKLSKQKTAYWLPNYSAMQTELEDSVWKQYQTTLSELGPGDLFIYSANHKDEVSKRLYPEIGNGHIATQIGNKWIFMNGLYNGKDVHSQRASIPSTVFWEIHPVTTEKATWTHTLNAAIGVFITRGQYQSFDIEVLSFASRIHQHLLVREIRVIFKNTEQVIVETKQGNINFTTPDLDIIVKTSNDYYEIDGLTKISETETSWRQPIHIISEVVPENLTFTKNKSSFKFLTSIGPFKEEVDLAFVKGQSIIDSLLDDQVRGWMQLWRNGRIAIVPNQTPESQFMARVIHASQYYLLSSLPWPEWEYSSKWPFFGLSPGGLAHGNDEEDYQGHVFWDMETWMFPPILMFYPELAQTMLDNRYYKLQSAMERANKEGYKGARFPWESAFTGFETSPWNLSANNEIHVIGDISLGVQQFLWLKANSDKKWYWDKGRKLLEEIARYWRSRLVYNVVADSYEIHNVMPPDEYVHCANNSAFTNAVAKIALQGPYIFSKRYGCSSGDNRTCAMVPEEYKLWFDVAESIFMPVDEKNEIYMEHDKYKLGTWIKQADVVLLSYPLQYPMPHIYKLNNAKYYASVTDKDGPAMTWGMYAIAWLELDRPDLAWNLFKQNFDYVRLPYYVWTEVRSGEGAINFLTGMGGYLQSVINGYGGIRIGHDQLQLKPYLPPDAQELQLNGIKFQDRSLNITVRSCSGSNSCCVEIVLNSGDSLTVSALESKITKIITVDSKPPLVVPCQKIIVKPK